MYTPFFHDWLLQSTKMNNLKELIFPPHNKAISDLILILENAFGTNWATIPFPFCLFHVIIF